MQTVRAIGLMSGTSMDGVDVAIIETDGRETVTLGPTGFFPYVEADRALLRRAVAEAASL
ncbi:MAG: anhydro-N-acetylmuramic acid kinase, partial [Methylocella sp.]